MRKDGEPVVSGPRTDLSGGRSRCHPLVRGHVLCSLTGGASIALQTAGVFLSVVVAVLSILHKPAPAADDGIDRRENDGKEDARLGVCQSGVDLEGAR
jgi:hypothetical protein